MIRLFDVFFSLLGIILLSPIFIILIIAGYFDSRSPIFLQERMGKNKKPFHLYKFRTMHKNTKSVSTHLVNYSSITKIGRILRKSKKSVTLISFSGSLHESLLRCMDIFALIST